jgi:hypothetical protein
MAAVEVFEGDQNLDDLYKSLGDLDLQEEDEPESEEDEEEWVTEALFTEEIWPTDMDLEERGKEIVSALYNQSAAHAFTGTDVFNAAAAAAEGTIFDTLGGRDGVSSTSLEEDCVFTFSERYSSTTFQGIMPDTGASGVSTGGELQFYALQAQDRSISLDKSTAGQHRIRFGKGEAVSLGTTRIDTPIGRIDFHILPTNTPFLLCIRDMDSLRVRLDNLKNILIKDDKLAIPIVRKWGHPWLLLEPRQPTEQFMQADGHTDDHSHADAHGHANGHEAQTQPYHQNFSLPPQTLAFCHLSEVQLRQLHRRFGHPSAGRLLRLLSRAGYKEIQPELVKELTRICHFCQLNTKAPGRFKFSLKDDIDFNYEIIIDIMYLDGRPVLHIVDAATAFQAARFLRKDVSTKSVWEALRLCWIDVYLGPPDIIITDAGKQLTSTEFNQNARAISIEVREVPVEAHHSIGKVERYHVPIRRAFNILKEELPDASTEGILQMAVKAVNDTAGPNGLVPTLLVFGAYPRMTREAPPSPSITQRAEAIQKAMKELRHLQAKRQVTEGLGMRNGPTPISTLPLQSQVIVWRENLGWKGPFTLLAAQGQTCLVEVNGRPVSFRSTSVRRYFEDSSPEGQGDQERPQDKQRPSSYQAPPQSGGTRETLHEQEQDWQPRRSKRKQKPKAVFDNSTFLSTKEQADLSLSLQLRKEGKIVTPGAPFEESDTKELENLLGQQVMNFIQFDPTKHRVRIFNSRMVREVKGKATVTGLTHDTLAAPFCGYR